MGNQVNHSYEFPPYKVDVTRRILLHDGKPVPLTPRAFKVLLTLVENNGRVVEKDELINLIWPGMFVEEGNLAVHIYTLRKVLGTTPDGRQYIETLPKRGYKFSTEVKETAGDEANLVLSPDTSTVMEFEGRDLDKTEKLIDSNMSPVSVSEASDRKIRGRWTNAFRGRATAILIILIMAAGMVAGFYLFRLAGRPSRFPSPEMRISKVTSIGTVRCGAVSPDGKYVAYVADGSLWIKHLPTESTTQINKGADIPYYELQFSPDGNYLYYRAEESIGLQMPLYRIAVLGGVSQKIIEDTSSRIAFSPDGRRLAFVRSLPDKEETALIIANADGSGQRTLSIRKGAEVFLGDAARYSAGPAWSPDGRAIACFTRTRTGWLRKNLVEIQVEDGAEKIITSGEWGWIDSLQWLSDGSGIVLIASDSRSGFNSQQVWHISYPEGEVQRITNDLNSYDEISLTRDSETLACLQKNVFSSIWVVSDGGPGQVRQIVSGTFGWAKLSWTPDGRIVYQLDAGDNSDIWIVDADGGNQKQLTNDPARDGYPAVTPDGRYIVFNSRRSGSAQIWRMNLDGGNPIQLTSKGENFDPQCSPDNRWVIYTSSPSSKLTLWRVPIDGGDPVQITDKPSLNPAISPDGKFIACAYAEDNKGVQYKTVIIPFEGGPPVKTFDSAAAIRWTRDGRALTLLPRDFASTIRIQPIDGTPARELINVGSEGIWAFDWSPDGKRLAFAQARITSDVVFISDFRSRLTK